MKDEKPLVKIIPDCPVDAVYRIRYGDCYSFPVDPGSVPFSSERFTVSGEGKKLRRNNLLTPDTVSGKH